MNPGPFLIIRTTFYLLLLAFNFFALINFENTKIYFLLATINKNPKISLFTSFSLLSSCSLLYCIFIIVICFTNIETLCLTTTWWSWGHKSINFALQVARRGKEKLRLIPGEFDINPESPLWGKHACCITLLLESQLTHLHSVIKPHFLRHCRGASKQHHSNCQPIFWCHLHQVGSKHITIFFCANS